MRHSRKIEYGTFAVWQCEQKYSVTIRAANLSDVAGVAKVHIESWRTTYKGIVPKEFLASLSYEQHEELWCQVLKNPSR